MQLLQLCFAASAFLAFAGTCVSLGGVAALQDSCGESNWPWLGGQVTCDAFLSLHWVTWALQASLLICIAIAAAARRIHSFKGTLWALGAVVVALGITECAIIYYLIGLADLGAGLPDPVDKRTWATLIGIAIWVSGDILLSFCGDAMYRANRIEGRDGFVTFRRKPANWQAQEEAAKEAAASAATISNSGVAAWVFLASLFVAVAGTIIALGGLGSLQYHCNNSVAGLGARLCNNTLSLSWVAFSMQVCFLLLTASLYASKQIHNFRTSLWSLAAATTSIICYVAYLKYTELGRGKDLLSQDTYPASSKAYLAGMCITAAGNFLLMMVGDYMYRLKHVEGADGFVSMRRPGLYAAAGPAGTFSNPFAPRRPIEWAFLGSIVLAFAGTVIGLGGIGAAQASCSPDTLSFRKAGNECDRWGSFQWWALALQIFVLGATLLAWATSYIHSYKASLWGLAAVVTYTCIISCNNIYSAWGWSTGRTHDSLVVALYGLAILVAGNFLLMATGDALHQLKREEGADGFVTFRRLNSVAPKTASESEPKTDSKV